MFVIVTLKHIVHVIVILMLSCTQHYTYIMIGSMVMCVVCVCIWLCVFVGERICVCGNALYVWFMVIACINVMCCVVMIVMHECMHLYIIECLCACVCV